MLFPDFHSTQLYVMVSDRIRVKIVRSKLFVINEILCSICMNEQHNELLHCKTIHGFPWIRYEVKLNTNDYVLIF